MSFTAPAIGASCVQWNTFTEYTDPNCRVIKNDYKSDEIQYMAANGFATNGLCKSMPNPDPTSTVDTVYTYTTCDQGWEVNMSYYIGPECKESEQVASTILKTGEGGFVDCQQTAPDSWVSFQSTGWNAEPAKGSDGKEDWKEDSKWEDSKEDWKDDSKWDESTMEEPKWDDSKEDWKDDSKWDDSTMEEPKWDDSKEDWKEDSKWDDSKEDWNNGKEDWNDGKEDWNDGKEDWNDGKEDWNDGKQDWNDGKEDWNDGKEDWNDGKQDWNDGKEDWNDGKEDWNDGKEDWNEDGKDYNEYAQMENQSKFDDQYMKMSGNGDIKHCGSDRDCKTDEPSCCASVITTGMLDGLQAQFQRCLPLSFIDASYGTVIGDMEVAMGCEMMDEKATYYTGAIIASLATLLTATTF